MKHHYQQPTSFSSVFPGYNPSGPTNLFLIQYTLSPPLPQFIAEKNHSNLHGRRSFEETYPDRRDQLSLQKQKAAHHSSDLHVHLLCIRLGLVEDAELHAGHADTRRRDSHVRFFRCLSRCSGSMLPEYRRGDVLLIDNRFHTIKIADIVVYNIPGRNIPIVHRVHVIHNPYALGRMR